MFVIGQFVFSIPAGGGVLAQTTSTIAIDDDDDTLTVLDTSDFLIADGYIVVDNEIMNYATKDATHFYGLTRGLPDPQVASVQYPPTSHPANSAVKSVAVQTLDSMLGMNITASTAPFGTLESLYIGSRFIANFPKFLAWDYPVLNQGQIVYLKYFILYPLSAGFVFALFFGMITLAMGVFNRV